MKPLSIPAIAQYTYPWPHGETLIVIADAKKEHLTEIASVPVIFLTPQDVSEWADVFALQFLHIQKTATLLEWQDIFADLTLKREDIQQRTEATARHLLIDIRELLLHKKTSYPDMTYIVDRLLIWATYLDKTLFFPILKTYAKCSDTDSTLLFHESLVDFVSTVNKL